MLVHGERLDGLHPTLRAFGLALAEAMPFDVQVTEGFRSLPRSAQLYAQGRTLPGPIVTLAQPGQSPHNWHLAFDAYPIRAGRVILDADAPEFAAMGAFAALHQEVAWGGGWRTLRDVPHFEIAHWHSAKGWDGHAV